jgi:hypothetical protein
MWGLVAALAMSNLALGYVVWRLAGTSRTAQREADDLAQVLDSLGVPERQRSPHPPRHNDGRSEVTKARWSQRRDWR